MIYLKLFEELTNSNLDSLYKKIVKHSYMSKSSIETLKSLGVSMEEFNHLKAKVSKAYEYSNLIKANEETLDYLFVELDDMLDEYQCSFKRGPAYTQFEVDHSTFFSIYDVKDPENQRFNLETNEIETTFEIIDSIISKKEELYKVNRENQKTVKSVHTNKYGRRDWGTLTKWKNSELLYKVALRFKVAIYISLEMPKHFYELDDRFFNNDAYRLKERVKDFVKSTFEHLFELNDIKIEIARIDNHGAYMFIINL